MTIMPDGSYEVKSVATDTERNKRRCLRCLFGYSYRSRWSVRADRRKDHLGLRLCDAVHRRQDQPHDKDLAFWNGTKGTRLGLNGRYPVKAESSYGIKKRSSLRCRPGP
jgi:hypothetical protein